MAYTKKPRIEKECAYCGKRFMTLSSEFCSLTCRGNKRYHDAGKRVICVDCGVDLLKGQHARCSGCQEKRNAALKKVYAKQRVKHSVKNGKKYPVRDMERHLENHRRNAENRRSRKLGLVADLTHEQWLEILEKFDNKCVYCGVTGVRLSQDHFIPVVRGGGYTKDNIVPACKKCNSSKKAKYPSNFLVDRLVTLAQILSKL